MGKRIGMYCMVLMVMSFVGNASAGTENTSNTFYGPKAAGSMTIRPPGNSESRSPMNPHVTGKTGAFFEGWYYRIADPDTGSRIAVIFASYLRPGEKYVPGMHMPGYLAVLVSKDGESRTVELFPEQTRLLKNGEPVNEYFAFNAPADFEWTCDYGTISPNSIDIDVPGFLTLRAKMENRIPWDKRSEMGPEGPMLFIRALKMHWYVYSMGSDTSYELILMQDGLSEIYEGAGYMHQEKNWGDTFPRAWIWLEGVKKDNSAHIALSGGQIQLVGKSYMTSWLAGYRSRALIWNFSGGEQSPLAAVPVGTIINTRIDGCAGTFYFSAATRTRTFVVTARAPVDSFFPVSIPTTNGFQQNGAVESFDSTITVSAYTNAGGRRLIERAVFQGAALEFGAGYKCQ